MNDTISFANICYYSGQQVFDFVVARLRAQGVPSTTPGHGCKYLAQADDGTPLRCAAGHLMTCMPAEKIAGYEGRTVSQVIAENYGELSPYYRDLVGGLQTAHDRWATNGVSFDSAFGHAAEAFGLDYKPCEETCDDSETE